MEDERILKGRTDIFRWVNVSKMFQRVDWVWVLVSDV